MRPAEAVIILALTSTLAMADVKTPEPVTAVFRTLDTDTDQRISRQEAKADSDLNDRFAAVDSDSDGYLDQSELLARPDDEEFE